MSINQSVAADYVFGGDHNELVRLLAQAADLRPESEWLLNEISIPEGSQVADIGCGPIGILDLLSQRVGPTGRVVGIEREPRFVAMAEAEVSKRGLRNTSIVLGDALAPQIERGSFDLVHVADGVKRVRRIRRQFRGMQEGNLRPRCTGGCGNVGVLGRNQDSVHTG